MGVPVNIAGQLRRGLLVACILGCAGATGCSSLGPGADPGASHRFSQIGRPRVQASGQAAPDAPRIIAQAAPLAPAERAQSRSPKPGAPGSHDPGTSPPAGATVGSTAITPASLAVVRRRVDAFLASRGFRLEIEVQGAATSIAATRMSDGQAAYADAVCGLEALRRPRILTTTVNLRLVPSGGGVAMDVDARYLELDQGVVSGALSRRDCRSRGALEAEVRRAARAG